MIHIDNNMNDCEVPAYFKTIRHTLNYCKIFVDICVYTCILEHNEGQKYMIAGYRIMSSKYRHFDNREWEPMHTLLLNPTASII